MKAIIKIVIAGLVVHACWRAGTVYWRYYQFKDEVRLTAQFSGSKSDQMLRERVMEVAERYAVPLKPENVDVRRADLHTYIDAVYTEQLELIPRYFYPWELKVNVDTFTITPKQASPPQ